MISKLQLLTVELSIAKNIILLLMANIPFRVGLINLHLEKQLLKQLEIFMVKTMSLQI